MTMKTKYNTDYKTYCNGMFKPDYETDSEEVSFEKYRTIIYYYNTEEFDISMCGPEGRPKNDKQRDACQRNATIHQKLLVPNYKIGKKYADYSQGELMELIKIYNDKYPKFERFIREFEARKSSRQVFMRGLCFDE